MDDKPIHVEDLDIDSFPLGQRTNVFVKVSEDGMGQPLELPCIVARGKRKGPVFGLTAAIHGNELNGIPTIHRLLDKIELGALHGTIVAVLVVNLPGFHANTRRWDNIDLNHIMPGSKKGAEQAVYSANFVNKIVKKMNYLVDLHTASFGRVNSLYIRASLNHPVAAQMAYLLYPQVILHNPASDRTLRGCAMREGIPAVTLEIGNPQRFQKEFIKRSATGLRRVLAYLKMLPKRKLPKFSPPIICDRSRWIRTKCGGLLTVYPNVTDQLAKGELFARQTDIFGAVCHEYNAPGDGIVIGKSVNPVSPTGARIIHFGHIADDISTFIPPESSISSLHNKIVKAPKKKQSEPKKA